MSGATLACLGLLLASIALVTVTVLLEAWQAAPVVGFDLIASGGLFGWSFAMDRW